MNDEQTANQTRRIVCAYDIEVLPTWWLQVHRWIKTRLEREQALVKVDLIPISTLPEGVDLLVVPPDVAAAAREQAPQTECLVVTADDYPKQIVELLDRLRNQGWYQIEVPAPEGDRVGKTVKHLGYERI